MATGIADADNYETVITIVRSWSTAKRLSLVQEVLATLGSDAPSVAERQPTLERALGLLATDKPAPSDLEIAELLEERRHERYGS